MVLQKKNVLQKLEDFHTHKSKKNIHTGAISSVFLYKNCIFYTIAHYL